MLTTDIISKPIINLYNGNYEGTVKNICFDNKLKKAQWLVFFDENEDVEDKVLDINKIHNVGPNAITIRSNEGIYPIISVDGGVCLNNPINYIVYNTQGEYIGKVDEVELSNKFTVVNITANGITVDKEQIISASNNTIIINNNNVKINLKKSKNKKMPTAKVSQVVSIQAPPKIETSIKRASIKFDATPVPTRIVSDASFLLGRRVTANIYGQNNEIIAKKDCKITNKHLEWAKKSNKLVELATYSTK